MCKCSLLQSQKNILFMDKECRKKLKPLGGSDTEPKHAQRERESLASGSHDSSSVSALSPSCIARAKLGSSCSRTKSIKHAQNVFLETQKDSETFLKCRTSPKNPSRLSTDQRKRLPLKSVGNASELQRSIRLQTKLCSRETALALAADLEGRPASQFDQL